MEDNKAYFEGVREMFEIAISAGNYEEVKAIIEMVRLEGFEIEAVQLKDELAEEKLGTFLYPSNEQIWK